MQNKQMFEKGRVRAGDLYHPKELTKDGVRVGDIYKSATANEKYSVYLRSGNTVRFFGDFPSEQDARAAVSKESVANQIINR